MMVEAAGICWRRVENVFCIAALQLTLVKIEQLWHLDVVRKQLCFHPPAQRTMAEMNYMLVTMLVGCTLLVHE